MIRINLLETEHRQFLKITVNFKTSDLMKKNYTQIQKIICLTAFILFSSLSFSQTYNPTAAAAYADQWAMKCPSTTADDCDPMFHNPAYDYPYYYPGHDCADFVSQCLIAGGL